MTGIFKRQSSVGAIGVLAIGLTASTPLNAADPFGIGGGAAGVLRQLKQGIPSPSSRPSRQRSNDGGDEEKSSSRSKSQAGENQEQRALDAKNAAMARAEWQELVRTARLEQERNVDA